MLVHNTECECYCGLPKFSGGTGEVPELEPGSVGPGYKQVDHGSVPSMH